MKKLKYDKRNLINKMCHCKGKSIKYHTNNCGKKTLKIKKHLNYCLGTGQGDKKQEDSSS